MTFPSELEKSASNATELNLHTISNLDNLFLGYLKASKSKRNKKAIHKFEINVGAELQLLHEELESKTYKPSKYRTFKVYEPKERIVVAPAFRDSVVQHTIYMLIYDIFDRSFISDSYGCRKQKGTHKASDKLQKAMRKHDKNKYYLQMDVRKYYYSISHDILKERISRKIKDKDLLELIMMFVDIESDEGLHVGSLLSQLFGLIYLDRLDQYVKRVLKYKHYIRYVDDFIIVGLEYQEAKQILKNIEKYIDEHLKLKLSKFRIAKIKAGCNYVGFRTWQSCKFIRKRSLHNLRKSLKKNKKNSIISILGNASHSSSHKHMLKTIKEYNVLQI